MSGERELRVERFRHDGLRWRVASGASSAIRSRAGWEKLSADGAFRRIQGRRDREVHEGWLRDCDPPLRVIAKTMRYPRLLRWLGHLLHSTRAAREWRYHSIAFRAGLPTVRPIALGERYRLGAPVASVLVTEYWEHDATLTGIARSPASAPALSGLLRALGEAVRDMHRLGLFHDDLHPANVLVRLTGDDPLRVIDWKHVRRSRWPLRRQAWSQLGKLTWQFENAALFRSDAPEREEAFYSGYAGQNAQGARSAVRGWLARTRARLGERAARRCTATNSMFSRLEQKDLVGFERRAALPATLRSPEALRSAAAAGAFADSGESRASIEVREVAVEPEGDPLRIWREANRVHASHPLSPKPIAWLQSRDSLRTGWLCTRLEDPSAVSESGDARADLRPQ